MHNKKRVGIVGEASQGQVCERKRVFVFMCVHHLWSRRTWLGGGVRGVVFSVRTVFTFGLVVWSEFKVNSPPVCRSVYTCLSIS